MYRHHAMCNGIYGGSCHHSHGPTMYSPYEFINPLALPSLNSCGSSYYHDYSCQRGLPCSDYSYHACQPRVLPRPPIVQTNVHNDVCYYVDDPCTQIYDDVYGSPYRLSRSKVQLVDLADQRRVTRPSHNRMVVSTFQPGEKRQTERIIYPRPTVGSQRRTKLVPLYHSADPHYALPAQRRSVVREIVPVATVADDRRQTIRVRSLSPL